jgi:hypothetical protein
LKSESYGSYGNGSQFNLSADYNGRLQIVSFALRRANGATLTADSYQFYADGRAKFADNQDETLDRSYSYDHSGRMTEAYSGSEARNFINGTQGGTATGAYSQSLQYDALSVIPRNK